MKTLVILTRRADAAAQDFKRLSKPEAMAVWQGLASGIVRAVHGLADAAGAALEMESATGLVGQGSCAQSAPAKPRAAQASDMAATVLRWNKVGFVSSPEFWEGKSRWLRPQ